MTDDDKQARVTAKVEAERQRRIRVKQQVRERNPGLERDDPAKFDLWVRNAIAREIKAERQLENEERLASEKLTREQGAEMMVRLERHERDALAALREPDRQSFAHRQDADRTAFNDQLTAARLAAPKPLSKQFLADEARARKDFAAQQEREVKDLIAGKTTHQRRFLEAQYDNARRLLRAAIRQALATGVPLETLLLPEVTTTPKENNHEAE